MHDLSIARNYAEALLALARKANAEEEWGKLINAVASAVEEDVRLRRFLEAPQVSGPQKNAVLAKALADTAPALFVRFLQKLVSNRRQMLIPVVATEYGNLLDETAGRVHARVTVARAMDENAHQAIVAQLSKALGRTVVPHVHVHPDILGGVVVRVGDTVMDGSVRRKLGMLRAKMLSGR